MGTADLRAESGVKDRATFTRALDELQAAMLVIPGDVVYEPFTYIWTLGVGRFPDGPIPGELARVTGLSRRDAGRGNRALVAEGVAIMHAPGTYELAAFQTSGSS
jgi:hypothetical protein